MKNSNIVTIITVVLFIGTIIYFNSVISKQQVRIDELSSRFDSAGLKEPKKEVVIEEIFDNLPKALDLPLIIIEENRNLINEIRDKVNLHTENLDGLNVAVSSHKKDLETHDSVLNILLNR